MKNALWKDLFREIKLNKGRFLSIFCIVMLGTAFFAGLRSTGFDMKYSADCFYEDNALMDVRVVSTLGLTKEDLRDLSENALALSKIYTKEGADVETLREAAVYTLAQKTGRQASDFENLPYSMLLEMAKQALVSDAHLTPAWSSLAWRPPPSTRRIQVT